MNTQLYNYLNIIIGGIILLIILVFFGLYMRRGTPPKPQETPKTDSELWKEAYLKNKGQHSATNPIKQGGRRRYRRHR